MMVHGGIRKGGKADKDAGKGWDHQQAQLEHLVKQEGQRNKTGTGMASHKSVRVRAC